jgi:hypothetical protein
MKFRNVKPVDGAGVVIKELKVFKENNPGALYFDSEFERKCYILLEDAGFSFDFHPEQREVMPGLTTPAISRAKGQVKIFNSKVRSINYTPDFVIYCNNGINMFIEAKGYFEDSSRMRYKLFQATLSPTEHTYLVYDKNNNKDLKELIKIVNKDFGGSNKDGENVHPKINKI